MWGSSFADLAKKAQELQDQATEAASSLSVSLTPRCDRGARLFTFLVAVTVSAVDEDSHRSDSTPLLHFSPRFMILSTLRRQMHPATLTSMVCSRA
jgi:hypothetical protein